MHPYPVENLTFVPDGNNLVASWDAPAEATPTGYNVYVNGQLVGENITETSYTQEGDPNSLNVVAVEALYQDDMVSVKAYALMEAALQDLGLITDEQSIALNVENPSAELVATNANHNSHETINIIGIEESNEEGVQYLQITSEELPFALEYGQDFAFTITPMNPNVKSVAQTTIKLASDAGDIEYSVEIDGELLSVNEITSTTKVYPNPANTTVRVEAENAIESVMVYNMMGALVETIPADGMIVNVNLSQYSNGVYFFNIRQSDGTVTNQRVVVSR